MDFGSLKYVHYSAFIHIISLFSFFLLQDYSMTILLHQFWNDPRLAYEEFANQTDKDIPFITSGYAFISKIWVPDLFFANEKRASFHDVTIQNRLIRLLPNGDLFYSMK